MSLGLSPRLVLFFEKFQFSFCLSKILFFTFYHEIQREASAMSLDAFYNLYYG